MYKNIGSLDSFCRLIGGFSALGYGIIKKSFGVIFVGAVFIAEGITRFCPFLHIMNMETLDFPCCHYDDDDDGYDDDYETDPE